MRKLVFSKISNSSLFKISIPAGILALSFVTGLQGCTGNLVGSTPPPTTNPIKHIVIIYQENRSFDNFFYGFPGADSATTGMSGTTQVTLGPVDLDDPRSLDNSHGGWWKDWDGGKMDGFARSTSTPTTFPYSYIPSGQIQPYWTMAEQYTLADRMFQSSTGPSFPAHLYLVAGQSGLADEDPGGTQWGCDDQPGSLVKLVGPNGTDLPGGVPPCFDFQTISDLLDAAKISWIFYTPADTDRGAVGSSYEAIKHIFYSSDWTNFVISPQTNVLTDVPAGKLAAVTWVIPDITHSDHPGTNSKEGPEWVASVVNAVGNSKFWDSTAIFITWDDWGGWYDHVQPPPAIDSMGPGFRVPLIVVSPYAKRGYVSHVQYETASMITFIEKNFNLPNLGNRDATATNLTDCFDFTQKPTPFQTISTTVTPEELIREPNTGAPDTDDVVN